MSGPGNEALKQQPPDQQQRRDWAWPFWPVVPLYPYGRRRTLRREIIKDTVWVFEQLQGIFYVIVPIRMTVICLEGGGLLVYAPVAPTRECIRLMRQLESYYGPVQYIVMSTVTGIEHKVFVGPFARHFPQAQVYVVPHQWSYPLNLPLSWLGLPPRRSQYLATDSSQSPFADQFDYALLGPVRLGFGPFAEVALCHRASRTLLVTDTVMAIPAEPPDVLQLDPYPLLFHAREHGLDPIHDTPANRRKGWQRIALFSFYFRPGPLQVLGLGEALREARQAPDHSLKAYGGVYPFRWQDTWQQSFEHLWRGGRPFVAPVLQMLILNRDPNMVEAWVNRVAQWQFERIIPAHFEAPIAAGPLLFRQAFDFLGVSDDNDGSPLPTADVALLQQLEQTLSQRGALPPRP
ncbi:hypothetical protein XM38_049830 [Halomicronema hongdechloris C2206]|uniref:DUF4336 domain-containing protein n=1 Tax=Halomicronema hongdechloris C2206 TaxID=1641165 RepID=A0A1Z3HUP1_9CYAN|nr:DUF4336 domain-containing protein [Halomicronema hongdechloris]ASC74009.1 hypothetical protein XM38_049830 [Halomicronema hongdechloris C2206]